MTVDHVECSELLGPLVAGRLDAARRADVESHLATCEECGEELRALRALVALETVELTPDERARLRSAITPVAHRPSWARFMPALAAAAVIALGVVAYGALDLGSTEEAGTSGATVDGDTAEEGQGTDPAARSKSLEAATSDAMEADEVTGNTIESDRADRGAAVSMGVQDAAGPSSADAMIAAPTVRFALTRLDPALLERSRRLSFYARSLPAGWVAQLETCTRRLFASQPVTLTLAYAQVFPRDDLLVAGFQWSEAASGEPTHFAFWGWWRGDCDTVSPVHARGTF